MHVCTQINNLLIFFQNSPSPLFVKIELSTLQVPLHPHPTNKPTNTPRGATQMARRGIRFVHGHTKSTLITYFSGMKVDPKYAFLHAFFLICPSCPFQNLSIWPKTHPFFQFCTPKQCTRVQCVVLKNNPNYVNFWMSLIPPLTFECPPPPANPTQLNTQPHTGHLLHKPSVVSHLFVGMW